MKATVKNYPKYFLKLKLKLKSELKRRRIKIARKRFKSNVGRAYVDLRTIKIPQIQDLESIYIILHETGHVIFDHGRIGNGKPNYLEETEAECFALATMKKWNLHKDFPKDFAEIKKRAEGYIRWNILYDIQRSLHDNGFVLKIKNIHYSALKFSQITAYKKRQSVIYYSKKKKIKR